MTIDRSRAARLLTAVLGVAIGLIGCQTADPTLTQTGRVSYSMGYQVGRNFTDMGLGIDVPVDLDILMQGLRDGLAEKPGRLRNKAMAKLLLNLQEDLGTRRKVRLEELANQNRQKELAFMEKNRRLPGVVTLPGGLQYLVQKKGTGTRPTLSDNVKLHYRGWTLDGREVVDTYADGEPQEVAVNAVLEGLKDALLRMRGGAKWKLFIPAKLAYPSDKPRPSGIAPNATLIYELELLEIVADDTE